MMATSIAFETWRWGGLSLEWVCFCGPIPFLQLESESPLVTETQGHAVATIKDLHRFIKTDVALCCICQLHSNSTSVAVALSKELILAKEDESLGGHRKT